MAETLPKVVITGLGCITASGANLDNTWQAICAGQTGLSPIKQWDVANWEHPLAGEIKNYNANQLISDRKLLKFLSRHDVIGLNAVAQAIKHSELLKYRASLTDPQDFNERTGIYVGSPGVRYHQQYDFHPLMSFANNDMKKFGEALFDHVHPMWLLRVLPNNVLAYTGIQYGFKGANQNITNHAVSGIQAIAEAYHALREGIIDRAVIVAYDASVEPQTQIYYGCLGLLSADGIFPFDERHNGTVLSEGAGAIILETETAAKQRQATIYGEILGEASVSEGLGVFSVSEDTSGVKRALKNVLQQINLLPEQIGMITTHGSGVAVLDNTEALAINEIFKSTVPVTSLKWSLGNTLTASGVIETLITLHALNQNVVPGIHGLQKKAKECSALAVSAEHQTPLNPTALVMTRGFSSLTSCLAIRANLHV
jgi:3-oxoacyl-[acyl-carrier-protein] synthase-1